jgi:hypothetical protein
MAVDIAHEQQQLAAQHEDGANHDGYDQPGNSGRRQQRT